MKFSIEFFLNSFKNMASVDPTNTAAVNCKQFHRSEFSVDKLAKAHAVLLIWHFFIDSLLPNLCRQR